MKVDLVVIPAAELQYGGMAQHNAAPLWEEVFPLLQFHMAVTGMT